jgi:hypothetical protein
MKFGGFWGFPGLQNGLDEITGVIFLAVKRHVIITNQNLYFPQGSDFFKVCVYPFQQGIENIGHIGISVVFLQRAELFPGRDSSPYISQEGWPLSRGVVLGSVLNKGFVLW